MSFFYDFLNYFNIDDLSTKTTITTIVGVGIMVVGKIKIKDIGESVITLTSNKEKIIIQGDNLNVKSISKGEIVVAGKIKNIEMGNL